MAKVLLGWEFGENFGHVALLAPVARALLAEGHDVVFAARDLLVTTSRLRSMRIDAKVIPAPIWQRPSLPATALVTFADVMVHMGFLDATRVRASVRAWAGLTALIDPDVVVVESAPLLTLVVKDRPCVALGVGYTLPALRSPLPPLQPWTRDVPEESRGHEARVLDVLRAVAKDEGARIPTAVSDLWAAPRFVCALPELDVYAAYRAEGECVGPLVPLAPRATAARPPLPGARPFAYLGSDYPRLNEVLRALSASTPAMDAHIRGATPATRQDLRARYPKIAFHDQPAAMTVVGETASSLVHHGGLNSCADALQLGLPQLVFPTNPEQITNSEVLARLGVGVSGPTLNVGPEGFIDALGHAMTEFMGAAAIASAATCRAADIAARPALPGLDAVLQHVRARIVAP